MFACSHMFSCNGKQEWLKKNKDKVCIFKEFSLQNKICIRMHNETSVADLLQYM